MDKKFNRFMSDITDCDRNKYFCMKCLLHFYSEESLKKHNIESPNCSSNNNTAKTTLPKKEKAFIEFKNHENKYPCPFVIYADFESNITHNHIPCGFTFKTISRIPEYNNFTPLSYRGEDAINVFLTKLLKQKNEIMTIIHQNNDMILTTEDKINYTRSIVCHICDKPLLKYKVDDHCHITGKYIGAAHYDCNINRNYKNYNIPVFFHNGKGYDSHLIINEIANSV